jgi:uridine phosphorylase
MMPPSFFELLLLLRVGLVGALAPSLELGSQLVAHPAVDGGIGGLDAERLLQPRLELAVTFPAVRVAELLLQCLANFGSQFAGSSIGGVVLEQSVQSLLLVEPEPAVEGGLVAVQQAG